jgi:hypothetical protein
VNTFLCDTMQSSGYSILMQMEKVRTRGEQLMVRALFLASTLLASCATQNSPPDYSGPDKTCIAGSWLSPYELFLTNEQNVLIASVNGQVRNNNAQYCYEPGPKVIEIHHGTIRPSFMVDEITFDAKPNVAYRISATRSPESIWRPAYIDVVITVHNDKKIEPLVIKRRVPKSY